MAECVAKKLGYRCISREVLVETARKYGTQEETLLRALTAKPGILERMSVERIHYLALIRATLYHEVKDDNVVYHGHAGHLLLKGIPHLLKVRVVADMEFRIKATMERNGLGRDEAVRYIKKVDEERARLTRFLYNVDWSDPSLYDIVVSLDRMSIFSACEIVCHAAGLNDFRATPDWEKVRSDLALSTAVRARIAVAKDIGALDRGIEIEANEGVITIGGKVNSLRDAEKIEAMVRDMPEVKDVVIRVEFFRHEGWE